MLMMKTKLFLLLLLTIIKKPWSVRARGACCPALLSTFEASAEDADHNNNNNNNNNNNRRSLMTRMS